MDKKQAGLEKVLESLLVLAPRIASEKCHAFLVGEPKLPPKLKDS